MVEFYASYKHSPRLSNIHNFLMNLAAKTILQQSSRFPQYICISNTVNTYQNWSLGVPYDHAP